MLLRQIFHKEKDNQKDTISEERPKHYVKASSLYGWCSNNHTKDMKNMPLHRKIHSNNISEDKIMTMTMNKHQQQMNHSNNNSNNNFEFEKSIQKSKKTLILEPDIKQRIYDEETESIKITNELRIIDQLPIRHPPSIISGIPLAASRDLPIKLNNLIDDTSAFLPKSHDPNKLKTNSTKAIKSRPNTSLKSRRPNSAIPKQSQWILNSMDIAMNSSSIHDEYGNNNNILQEPLTIKRAGIFKKSKERYKSNKERSVKKPDIVIFQNHQLRRDIATSTSKLNIDLAKGSSLEIINENDKTKLENEVISNNINNNNNSNGNDNMMKHDNKNGSNHSVEIFKMRSYGTNIGKLNEKQDENGNKDSAITLNEKAQLNNFLCINNSAKDFELDGTAAGVNGINGIGINNTGGVNNNDMMVHNNMINDKSDKKHNDEHASLSNMFKAIASNREERERIRKQKGLKLRRPKSAAFKYKWTSILNDTASASKNYNLGTIIKGNNNTIPQGKKKVLMKRYISESLDNSPNKYQSTLCMEQQQQQHYYLLNHHHHDDHVYNSVNDDNRKRNKGEIRMSLSEDNSQVQLKSLRKTQSAMNSSRQYGIVSNTTMNNNNTTNNNNNNNNKSISTGLNYSNTLPYNMIMSESNITLRNTVNKNPDKHDNTLTNTAINGAIGPLGSDYNATNGPNGASGAILNGGRPNGGKPNGDKPSDGRPNDNSPNTNNGLFGDRTLKPIESNLLDGRVTIEKPDEPNVNLMQKIRFISPLNQNTQRNIIESYSLSPQKAFESKSGGNSPQITLRKKQISPRKSSILPAYGRMKSSELNQIGLPRIEAKEYPLKASLSSSPSSSVLAPPSEDRVDSADQKDIIKAYSLVPNKMNFAEESAILEEIKEGIKDVSKKVDEHKFESVGLVQDMAKEELKCNINPKKLKHYEIEIFKAEYAKPHNERNYEKIDQLLARLKFFEKLMKPIRIKILENAHYLHVPQGKILFNQGDYGDLMYIIVKGSVEIRKVHEFPDKSTGSNIIASLYDGNHFGELAMMGTKAKNMYSAPAKSELIYGLKDTSQFINNVINPKDEKEYQERRERINQISLSLGEYHAKQRYDAYYGDDIAEKQAQIAHNNGIIERTKRAATAKIAETSDLLALSREKYQDIMLSILQSDIDEKINLLLTLPFFHAKEAYSLIPLANNLGNMSFKIGQRIIKEGSSVDLFYIIAKGRIEVVYEEIEVDPIHIHVFRKKRKPFIFKTFKQEKTPHKPQNLIAEVVKRETLKTVSDPNYNSRTYDNEIHINANDPEENTYKRHILIKEMKRGDFFGIKSLFITDEDELQGKIDHLKAKVSVIAATPSVELFTLDRKNLIYVTESIKNVLFQGLKDRKDFDDVDLIKYREERKAWHTFKHKYITDTFKWNDLEKKKKRDDYKAY